MKQTILIISMALTLFSCSNGELSRGDAEDQIIEHFQYPNVELANVNYESMGRHSRIPDGYAELVIEGYLSYIDKQFALKFKRTAKSEPYFLEYVNPFYKFAGNELAFGEITGIKLNDTKNYATAYYTTVRNNITPFGTFAKRSEGETLENEATFEKFDDGWRIVGSKPQVIKKTQVLGFDKSKMAELNNVLDEVTMETTDSYFILKNTYKKFGKNFIEVDFVGVDGSNTNPKLRTFLVDDTFYTDNMCGQFGKSGMFKNLKDVKGLTNSDIAYIQVVDGVVKCIEINSAG